ncbi:MAG: prepilin peptidase [Candidatus Omnitrophica bacterium]|nr:prepilin peptidase [Candidatus Omnitrophota bacterium]MBU4487855.1 prepilin peptidase [Candidatus Omnitrophota bacterium]MCG2704638.1 prepilin peptidase [Candidatus Omnitrophota bacterium]
MGLKIFIFIMGSVVGSFLNVCIHRLPRNESIVYPPSHCVNCNNRLHWYDNIPFLSYIFLRGRCRFCARTISPRYFIVELTSALLFLALFISFGSSEKFAFMALLVSALIAATFIDFDFQIIPDSITVSGIIIGLIAAYIFPSIFGEISRQKALINSLLGVLVGGGSIYLIGVLGTIAFKKDAMGGGDVKLMAMIGAFLGWKMALLVFFIAPFFGAFVGIMLKVKYKIETIPYGPYISLAAIIVIFWGDRILSYLFLY